MKAPHLSPSSSLAGIRRLPHIPQRLLSKLRPSGSEQSRRYRIYLRHRRVICGRINTAGEIVETGERPVPPDEAGEIAALIEDIEPFG